MGFMMSERNLPVNYPEQHDSAPPESPHRATHHRPIPAQDSAAPGPADGCDLRHRRDRPATLAARNLGKGPGALRCRLDLCQLLLTDLTLHGKIAGNRGPRPVRKRYPSSFRQSLGGDRIVEDQLDGPGPDKKAALRLDEVRPYDGHRHDGNAGPDRHQEAPVLERKQGAVTAPRSLRVNHDGGPGSHSSERLLRTLPRTSSVLPLERDEPNRGQRPTEDGNPEEPPLRDHSVAPSRVRVEESQNVEGRSMVRGEQVDLLAGNPLASEDLDLDTANPERDSSPRLGSPLENSATRSERQGHERNRSQDGRRGSDATSGDEGPEHVAKFIEFRRGVPPSL